VSKYTQILSNHNTNRQTEKIDYTPNLLRTSNPVILNQSMVYDVDDNGYLVPCEKEQTIIRLNESFTKER
jgi:hypothetical protein